MGDVLEGIIMEIRHMVDLSREKILDHLMKGASDDGRKAKAEEEKPSAYQELKKRAENIDCWRR